MCWGFPPWAFENIGFAISCTHVAYCVVFLPSVSTAAFQQSAMLVMELLSTTEPNLLVNAICAMKAVFTYAIMHSIVIHRHADIRDHLDNLFVHPIQQIADLACSLEDMVSSYADTMEDDDGVDYEEDDVDEY